MHTTHLVSLLALAFPIANLSSQVITPPGAASQLGGSTAGFPFSYNGYVRYQQAIDKSYLRVGNIYGMSLRSRTTVRNVPERQWQGMKVTLADLPFARVSSMSGTFANNLGANKSEVFAGRLNLYRPNSSDALEFSITIPFAKPFLYLATTPLTVELMPTGYEGFPNCPSGGNGTSMDGTRDTNIFSVLGKGSCSSPPATAKGSSAGGFVIKFFYAPMLMPYGKGCKGSNGKIPQIGSTGAAILGSPFTFTMTDVPATSKAAIFIAGLSNTDDGATRLPLDLSFLTTAAGCWQNTDMPIFVILPITSWQVTMPEVIPNNPAIKGLPIYSQFVADDPGIGGFTSTQGGVIRPQ